jgi:hypothetical protein
MGLLTDKVNDMDKRLEALENDQIDNKQLLALITKIYGDFEIAVTVNVEKHQNWMAGTHVYNANGNLYV